MNVRCVIVGIDHWVDLTSPFVDSMLRYNPWLDIVLIDNASVMKYPGSDRYRTLHTDRIGYGPALNIGAMTGMKNWDWLMCCNNDCLCNGAFTVDQLNPNVMYGNAWKLPFNDPTSGLPEVVDSAYLLISNKMWGRIGGFDPDFEAAFEEIDYQVRAVHAGFGVDVAYLPIIHLDRHTRYETPNYEKRWENARKLFLDRYMRIAPTCPNCHNALTSFVCPSCGHDSSLIHA